MKRKILCLISLSLFFIKVNAQIVPQKVFVGGQINSYKDDLYTEKTNTSFTITDKAKYSRLTILPSIGYSISETTAIGLEIGYSNQKRVGYNNSSSIFTDYDYKSNYLHINPYFRLGKKVVDNLYFQNKISLDFSIGKQKGPDYDENYDEVTKVSKFISIGPSYTPEFYYIINSKLGLKLNLGSIYLKYSKESQHDDSEMNFEDDKQFDFNFDIDFRSIGLGLEFYL